MEIKIREYAEQFSAEIERLDPKEVDHYVEYSLYAQAHKDKRWVIRAWNEGGHNHTMVDLIDVLRWTKANLPEVWEEI